MAPGLVQPTCYRSAWISSEGAEVNSLLGDGRGLPKVTRKLMVTAALRGPRTVLTSTLNVRSPPSTRASSPQAGLASLGAPRPLPILLSFSPS